MDHGQDREMNLIIKTKFPIFININNNNNIDNIFTFFYVAWVIDYYSLTSFFSVQCLS